MSKISNSRKATYYIGIGMMIIGFILFISVAFGIVNMGSDINSQEPSFQNALIGIILIFVGSIVMSIGARGAAGSGLILDPKKQREELKPFHEAKGEMINDIISNIDVIEKLSNGQEEKATKEVIKVRCRNCQSLNDEDAKFCKECGKEI